MLHMTITRQKHNTQQGAQVFIESFTQSADTSTRKSPSQKRLITAMSRASGRAQS